MKREGLLTINQAAEVVGVSRQAIHAAINDQRLAVVKVPSVKLMITPEALADFKPNRMRQAIGQLRVSKSPADNTK